MRDRALTVTGRHSHGRTGPSYGRSVSSQRPAYTQPITGLTAPDPVLGNRHAVGDAHLHGDDDSICPRCLTWIDGRDFVRRNALGLLQHEHCG